jgi:hypothetical protein
MANHELNKELKENSVSTIAHQDQPHSFRCLLRSHLNVYTCTASPDRLLFPKHRHPKVHLSQHNGIACTFNTIRKSWSSMNSSRWKCSQAMPSRLCFHPHIRVKMSTSSFVVFIISSIQRKRRQAKQTTTSRPSIAQSTRRPSSRPFPQ